VGGKRPVASVFVFGEEEWHGERGGFARGRYNGGQRKMLRNLVNEGERV